MMIRKICFALAGGALLALLACDTNQKPAATAPGALPQSKDVTEPRVNASTYVAHGELLERRGDLERAAQQYVKALELSPGLFSAQNRLGITLNKLGRHEEATAAFRAALGGQPDQPFLYNNLGFSLCLEKKYEEAEPVLSRAVTLQPSFRRARMNHGLVLARLGRYEEALAEFQHAGSEADAHFNVAVVQAEVGEYALAARSLERALQCDPNLTAAHEQLRQVSQLAAAQEATEAEAKALAARPAEPAAPEPVQTVADVNAEVVTVAPETQCAEEQVAPVEVTPPPSVEVIPEPAPQVLEPVSMPTEPVVPECPSETPVSIVMPTDDAGGDFATVADVALAASVTEMEAPPAMPDDSELRAARVYQRITNLLEVQERPFSTATMWWTPGTLEPVMLRQMLSELIYGASIQASWLAERVGQYEELLGLDVSVR